MKLPKKEGFYSGICILLLFYHAFLCYVYFQSYCRSLKKANFFKDFWALISSLRFQVYYLFQKLEEKNTSYQLFLHDDKENT
jgi:hypothetical protein